MAPFERLNLVWYLTGPEALTAYDTPRQTLDIDIVIEAADESLGGVDHLLAAVSESDPDAS